MTKEKVTKGVKYTCIGISAVAIIAIIIMYFVLRTVYVTFLGG